MNDNPPPCVGLERSPDRAGSYNERIRKSFCRRRVRPPIPTFTVAWTDVIIIVLAWCFWARSWRRGEPRGIFRTKVYWSDHPRA